MNWKKTYSLSADTVDGEVDHIKLISEIEAAGITSATLESVASEDDEKDPDELDVYFDVEPSAGDLTALDAVVNAHQAINLDEYKEAKKKAINKRSGELIDQGYVYQGITFSLSKNAQHNLTGADNARLDLTYPITWNNIDDTDTYDVTDAVDMHNMYLTALGTKKAHLDSGRALKTSVNAATTKAEVDAVVDTR